MAKAPPNTRTPKRVPGAPTVSRPPIRNLTTSQAARVMRAGHSSPAAKSQAAALVGRVGRAKWGSRKKTT